MKRLKITKKKAEEFCKSAFGTFKGLQVGTGFDSWEIEMGQFRYHFWVLDGRIYCQFLIGCECFESRYFNFDTYEYDWDYSDSIKEKDRNESWRSDRLDTLLWLREKGVNVPDDLVSKYESRW